MTTISHPIDSSPKTKPVTIIRPSRGWVSLKLYELWEYRDWFCWSVARIISGAWKRRLLMWCRGGRIMLTKRFVCLLFVLIIWLGSVQASYAQGPDFQEFQSLPTNGAMDWEHFAIGSDHYLVVANVSNDSTVNIDSKISRWDGSGFVEFQAIPTTGATDWEHFTIGSDHYLAVAKVRDDSFNYNLDSKVYRWDGANFVEVQAIPTIGAYDWEYFTIGGEHYLAVANAYNGPVYNLDSKIYRWDGMG